MRRRLQGRFHRVRPQLGRRARPVRGPVRRFPYSGLVPVAFGVLGPLAAAGAAQLYALAGREDLLRETVSGQVTLPPSPSLDNVLFGVGLPEAMLAGALGGWLLWRILWRPVEVRWGRDQWRGIGFGALLGLALIPLGIIGVFIRTGMTGIPWFEVTFYALIAAVVGTSYLVFAPWVWLTMLGLGALGGLSASVAVDLIKPRMPVVER